MNGQQASFNIYMKYSCIFNLFVYSEKTVLSVGDILENPTETRTLKFTIV